MTLNDFVAAADAALLAYDPSDDMLISDFVGPDGRVKVDHPTGDTIKLFVAHEMCDVYEEGADPDANAEELSRALRSAGEELLRLADAVLFATPRGAV